MIAETASLELVANGSATNEMKKEGIFVAVEKLSTASTRGSANAAAMAVPSNKSEAALIEVFPDLWKAFPKHAFSIVSKPLIQRVYASNKQAVWIVSMVERPELAIKTAAKQEEQERGDRTEILA
nr:hypothetical protein TEA_007235 [Ipomoea batatas]